MRRSLATAAILAVCLVLGAACGGEAADPPPADSPTQPASTPAAQPAPAPAASESPSEPAADAPLVIEVRFADGTVTPNGERVDVAVGRPIELEVTSQQAGEIHVHATPEQELEYGAGTTTLSLSIDTPGVVDVESHDLEQIIVQLEVR